MEEWTIRPVESASLAAAALNRERQDQPRDQRAPRRRQAGGAAQVASPSALPESDADPGVLDVELGPGGELAAVLLRDRDSGQVLRRFEGAALEGLLRARSAPGSLMERSG